MTAAVATANAATDEAGNNFIYLASFWNNTPPHVQFADEWEQYKMPETAPGSNIYETVVPAGGTVFYFHYDLADTADPYNARIYNAIYPGPDFNPEVMPFLPTAGKSGICATSDFEMSPVYVGPSNAPYYWQLPTPSGTAYASTSTRCESTPSPKAPWPLRSTTTRISASTASKATSRLTT